VAEVGVEPADGAMVEATTKSMRRPGRRGRRSNWMSYEASRRLQRDAMVGLSLLLAAAVALLLLGASSSSFSVRFESGVPIDNDGNPCLLLATTPVNETVTDEPTMVDCGDRGTVGVALVLQHLFVALGAVGLFLVLSSAFSLFLASRMPTETLAVPVAVVAGVAGIVLIWWGLGAEAPSVAIQGDRVRAVVGLVREAGLGVREGGVAAGTGLVVAAFMRLARP